MFDANSFRIGARGHARSLFLWRSPSWNGPGKATLTLPTSALVPSSDLQLLVLPIGGTDVYRSPPFHMDAGDVVTLQIENSLPLSTLVVQPRR